MDEKIPAKNRQFIIDIFNDLTSEARVLLASTKHVLKEYVFF